MRCAITRQPDITINETTGTYFRRLATIAPPEQATYYRDVIAPDPQVARAGADWLFEHEPHHASMVRTSVSPNIATRSGCSRASCTGSCGSTGKSSARSHARNSDAASAPSGRQRPG